MNGLLRNHVTICLMIWGWAGWSSPVPTFGQDCCSVQRIVYKTVYNQQQITAYRLQYETVIQEQAVTVSRPRRAPSRDRARSRKSADIRWPSL